MRNVIRQHPRETLILALLLVTFPLVVVGSSLASGRFRNEITEWSDPSTLASQQFREYQKQFGTNEYVLLTWPGCQRDDPRLIAVEQRLLASISSSERVPDASDSPPREGTPQPLIASVTSGQTLFEALIDEAKLSPEEALERLRGSIFGQGGQQTGIVLTLSESGRQQRANVFAELRTVLSESSVNPDDAHYAGLGHDLYLLDEEGFQSPFRMVPAIMLLALLLTWLFVRSFSLACFINFLGTFTGCLAFTFIYFSSINLNAIVWPLPTLLMLLTVSASLHFLSYYRNALARATEESPDPESVTSQSPADVARQAVSHALLPILCCTLTTTVGLFSLCLSHTRPVRQFGFFGGISVLAACGILLLGLPAWLTLIPPQTHGRTAPGNTDGHRQFWPRLAALTCRFRVGIIFAGLIVMVGLGSAIPTIKTGGNLRNFFPAGHRVLTDAVAIESEIGPLSSIELLLTFSNPQETNDFQRIALIDRLSQTIIRETDIEAATSAATLTPSWDAQADGLRRTIQQRKLRRFRIQLQRLKLLSVGQGTETWRVSLRYSGLATINVSRLIRQIEDCATEAFRPDGTMTLQDEELSVIPTGEFVLFDHVDRQFLRDLTTTYSTAFVLIAVVVLLVLRSWPGMLLASLPNLFPALIVLGAAGWLGQSLDVASLMTASVALGIAVDDTLHFVMWWRDRLQAGDSPEEAIVDAMQHCGFAMVQTSVACGASIVLYAFCGFLPTVRFGILLASMLSMALIGDLILLPALLSTRLARYMIRKMQSPPSA